MSPLRILTRQRVAGTLLIIGVSCLGLAANQIRKSDVEHDGFKGRVRTVLIESAKLSKKGGNQTERRREFISKWTYDTAGRLVEEEMRNSHRLYRYVNGNRYEKRSSLLIGAPPTADDFEWVARYDAAGNRIEEAIFSGPRQRHSRFIYTYDDSGRRVSVTYDARDSPTKRFTYSYDETGHLRERLEYKEREGVASRRQQDFVFDSTGNWIKSTTSVLRKKAGKQYFEPVEVSYRTITYY